MPVNHSPESQGAEGVEKPERPTCTICNDNLNSDDKTVTSCNHSFHTPCLARWLETSQTCPICRQSCNSLDLSSQNQIPSRNDPSTSRNRGAIPRDRPNTRLYAQQHQRGLGSFDTMQSPVNRRRTTNFSNNHLSEQRVQHIITESLNAFRTDFSAVITAELQSMFQNLNIEANRNNIPNSRDHVTNRSNTRNPVNNTSNIQNLVSEPPPEWPEDNPFRANQTFEPTAHRRSGPNLLPLISGNITNDTHKISNLIYNWHIKYNGSDDSISVDEFIYRINTLTSIHLNGNFNLLCEHVHSLFEGKALKWFWRYHRQADSTLVWFDICDALRRQFKDTTTDYDIKDDMRRRKQKINENFDTFLESMMYLSDRLRIPIGETELVEIIIRNLKADLRHELLHLNISDLSTLRKEARKHEKFFEDLVSSSSHRPKYSRPQISEIVREIPIESQELLGEEISKGINEINEIGAYISKCWNCDGVGHRYHDCVAPRRIFCYGCGAIDTIFSETPISKKRLRSKLRIRSYWGRRKQLKNVIISSIVNTEGDSRPYVKVIIMSRTILALLDSGANRSCIGGSLAEEILSDTTFSVDRFKGKVRTADGQNQQVVGSISLDIKYNCISRKIELLIVPSLRQSLICGIDFWNSFGLEILQPTISEVLSEDDNSEVFKLNPNDLRKLNAAIASFPSFEMEGLDKTTLIEHVIDTGTARPIKQRYYPISPAREKVLCQEIDRMLQLGVIEVSENSPWSSPGVLLVKPGKVRFCLDSRKLNDVTTKDAYPIPNIDGLISRLPPVNIISKIDLKDAFWQIELSKESRPKTAFTVPNRPLYQFVRMPFGLCNAPQTMCRLMDKVIPYDLKGQVFVYLDDLLVVSHSLDEHIVHLLQVASLLRKAGLTINIAKSKFGLRSVKYLGYVVGNGTLMVDPDKVIAISEYPTPKTVRQLRQFLGLAGWYRRFVADYASITFPLTELLSKKRNFMWNCDAQLAFETLKTCLTTAPFLSHPNYNKPFIVQCDASQYGVGGVLAQCDDNGDERPIAFMSHKLNKAQRNYSVTELECLAVVLAIKKFRAYIEGHQFKVVTDHASLKWLMGQKDLSGRLARWALKLQGYHFSIEHRKGRENVVADALSRTFDGGDLLVEELEIDSFPIIDLSSDAFDSAEYSNLRDKIEKAELPHFRIIGKFIYHKMEFEKGTERDMLIWKLLVPNELRNEVLIASHDQPSSSHGGIAKTLDRIRRYFYWPGMVADVRRYVAKCELCTTSKTPTYTLRPPMGQMAESQRPFQRLYVDFIGPFPRTVSI
ncbi:uncharacterized protein LOC135955566 [Calliphora vicina]|uniref:uncharacterized protein LOC135955566 n=1 Tax=Calliphora vicina TaxID=7373 RepID=UPI00325AF8C9